MNVTDFSDFSFLTLLTTFFQGILSFASPCVLPLLPVYFGYLSGGSETDENGKIRYSRKKAIVNSLFFAVGIGAAFFILGLGASALGKFLVRNSNAFSIAGGILIILFGLLQLGFFGSNSFLQKEKRIPVNFAKLKLSPLTAILFGFVFSFSWTPCVGPALASILVMTTDAASKSDGMIYIFLYTLGFAVPFIITGIFVSSLLDFFRKHRNIVKWTTRIGGIILICVGIFMTANGIIMQTKRNASSSLKSVNENTNETSTGQMNSSDSEKNRISSPEETETPEKQENHVPDKNRPSAPEFSLTDQYGSQWTLSELKGKTVILNFWATWCPPCRMEMPDFQNVYDELIDEGNEDVFILGIAAPNYFREKDLPEIVKFLDTNGYSYPCLMDFDGIVTEKYYISAFPTTFLIDKNGKVQNGAVGAISETRLRNFINEGLAD